jgi:hypothetical protein
MEAHSIRHELWKIALRFARWIENESHFFIIRNGWREYESKRLARISRYARQKKEIVHKVTRQRHLSTLP